MNADTRAEFDALRQRIEHLENELASARTQESNNRQHPQIRLAYTWSTAEEDYPDRDQNAPPADAAAAFQELGIAYAERNPTPGAFPDLRKRSLKVMATAKALPTFTGDPDPAAPASETHPFIARGSLVLVVETEGQPRFFPLNHPPELYHVQTQNITADQQTGGKWCEFDNGNVRGAYQDILFACPAALNDPTTPGQPKEFCLAGDVVTYLATAQHGKGGEMDRVAVAGYRKDSNLWFKATQNWTRSDPDDPHSMGYTWGRQCSQGGDLLDHLQSYRIWLPCSTAEDPYVFTDDVIAAAPSNDSPAVAGKANPHMEFAAPGYGVIRRGMCVPFLWSETIRTQADLTTHYPALAKGFDVVFQSKVIAGLDPVNEANLPASLDDSDDPNNSIGIQYLTLLRRAR